MTPENNPADMPSGEKPGPASGRVFIYDNAGGGMLGSSLRMELCISDQFLESLPFPLFIKDLQGRYVACNKHFCDLFGFTSDQILGNSIDCLFDQETAEIHITADRQLIESGLRVVYETKVSGPEIRYGLVRVIKSPLNDEKGNLYGIIGLISEINQSEDNTDISDVQNSDIEAFLKLKANPKSAEEQAGLPDLSESSGMKEKVPAFEKGFDLLLKSLNAGLWEFYPETGKLHWSEKCFEVFGLDGEMDKPEDWMVKVFPEDISRVQEMWARIPLRTGWFELEFRIVVDGTIRWVKKSGYFLKGKDAATNKITGVIADISDEKDFSERLFESQRFFKAIVEDQSELICRFRPDGTVTFINRAFARFFNVSAEGYINHLLSEVFTEKEYSRILKSLKCIRPAKQFVDHEQRISREGGMNAIIHWTIRAIYNKNDLPEEFQLVGRDVTEIEASREALRRSEEMFRLIAENSNDIISIHPDDGTIEYVSPSVKHILGYNPDDLTGSRATDLVFQEDHGELQACGNNLSHSIDPVLLTFRLKDYHGNLIWFESMVQRQYNNNGEATGKVIAVSRNIHSRKLVEEQQKLTELQLKEANITKDKFFSIIAHDLRSPFTSILGFTRLLNEEYDDFSDEERKLMVKQIQNSTESTFQLLDNLLAWAKTQLGRTIYNPEIFTLENLIAESVKQTTPQAQIKKITITCEKFEDVKLYADQNMIRTVLRNLLSNAIKFSFPEGVIEIETSTGNDQVIIGISDHGTGIKPEVLNKLFSLTEQATTTKGTANEKGTGLGLILCKEFVERNGGIISVRSEVGKGSTFSFSVPLSKAPAN